MISSNLGCLTLNLRTPVEGFASRIGRLGRAALVNNYIINALIGKAVIFSTNINSETLISQLEFVTK